MDFLLECIGFPPDHPLDELVERVRAEGESAPWRGPADMHMRLALGGGLELRADRDEESGIWSILPHFQSNRRLRVAVDEIRSVPDSRFDALLVGWAAPPIRAEEKLSATEIEERADTLTAHAPGAYPLSTYLTDARRLPARLPQGHVLAVSVAGFALDVSYLGTNSGVFDRSVLELESGASIRPLGAADDPGGCAEVSLRIQEVLHLENPITKVRFDRLEVDAPARPHTLFVSQWQLDQDGLPPPRPGLRVEGTFMFSGRIAGGLPGPKRRARGNFG